MSDAWQKYNLFTDLKRKNQDIMEFISEWNNCLHKANKAGCEFSDVILGFKLLRDANLKEIESNLVLTGVDFQTGKDEGKLLEQVTNSLKKFKGRKNIVETDKNAVAMESVLMSEEMESALIAKGWKPPKKPRKRSRSVSPNAKDNSGGGGYKGRKNPLDSNFKVMKCFLCARFINPIFFR